MLKGKLVSILVSAFGFSMSSLPLILPGSGLAMIGLSYVGGKKK